MLRDTWVFALVVLQMGCGAGWRTRSLVDGPLPRRQQAQVWTEGRAQRWHALVVGPDSISGVPFTQPPACDSCRVAVPRDLVDSVRLGNPSAGFWKTMGLVVGIPIVAVVAICRTDTCQFGD